MTPSVPAANQPQQEATQLRSRKRSGPKSRSSIYKGVTQYRRTGKWEAHIWIKGSGPRSGHQRHLGSYHTAEDAARAFDRATIRLRGPDEELNFPYETYDNDEFLKAHAKTAHPRFLELLRLQFAIQSEVPTVETAAARRLCRPRQESNGHDIEDEEDDDDNDEDATDSDYEVHNHAAYAHPSTRTPRLARTTTQRGSEEQPRNQRQRRSIFAQNFPSTAALAGGNGHYLTPAAPGATTPQGMTQGTWTGLPMASICPPGFVPTPGAAGMSFQPTPVILDSVQVRVNGNAAAAAAGTSVTAAVTPTAPMVAPAAVPRAPVVEPLGLPGFAVAGSQDDAFLDLSIHGGVSMHGMSPRDELLDDWIKIDAVPTADKSALN